MCQNRLARLKAAGAVQGMRRREEGGRSGCWQEE